MGRKYEKVYDGEIIQPRMRNYKMRCCDCSLVHTINFYIVTKGKRRCIKLKVTRDERATAACRRKRNGPSDT